MKFPLKHGDKPDEDDAADKTDKGVAKRAPPLKIPEPKVLGKITWLGEGEDGPRVNTWNGLEFKAGEAVEVTSQHMIDKAKNNRFYDVTEYDAPKRGEEKKPETAAEKAAAVKAQG